METSHVHNAFALIITGYVNNSLYVSQKLKKKQNIALVLTPKCRIFFVFLKTQKLTLCVFFVIYIHYSSMSLQLIG